MFCFASFFSISNCFLSNVSGGAVEQVEHIRGGRESRNVSPLAGDVATKELSKATKTDVEDKGGWRVGPGSGQFVRPKKVGGSSERAAPITDRCFRTNRPIS